MKSVLNLHWKDWCWSLNSNTLATRCKELTQWKRPWCWEGLGTGREEDDRGQDGWMASQTRWTWVWVNSGSWWWTGRPGVLQSKGSQSVGHSWATEVNSTYLCYCKFFLSSFETQIILVASCLFYHPQLCFLSTWQPSFEMFASVPHFPFQFTSVQLLSPVWLLAIPWTAARQASLSTTNSWSLLKLMPIKSVMPFNHLILCCPLLLLPSIFPSIRVFSNESVLHIRWPKFWHFSFSTSPSNEHLGLISFRILLGLISCSSSDPQESSPTSLFMLRFDRKQQNSVKQLSFNKR